MSLYINTVENISIKKKILTFDNFVSFKNAFEALRKHFYKARARFFKLKFVKFLMSRK